MQAVPALPVVGDLEGDADGDVTSIPDVLEIISAR